MSHSHDHDRKQYYRAGHPWWKIITKPDDAIINIYMETPAVHLPVCLTLIKCNNHDKYISVAASVWIVLVQSLVKNMTLAGFNVSDIYLKPHMYQSVKLRPHKTLRRARRSVWWGGSLRAGPPFKDRLSLFTQAHVMWCYSVSSQSKYTYWFC